MRIFGLILLVVGIIGLCCGFFYANSADHSWDYEFSLALAWPWFTSALYLFTASIFCFAINTAIKHLEKLASNSEKLLGLMGSREGNALGAGDYSKPGDYPGKLRLKGETDAQYWSR